MSCLLVSCETKSLDDEATAGDDDDELVERRLSVVWDPSLFGVEQLDKLMHAPSSSDEDDEESVNSDDVRVSKRALKSDGFRKSLMLAEH